jgi:murein DD-endopeptidase MepM/ murein hydrolase activator NlpD
MNERPRRTDPRTPPPGKRIRTDQVRYPGLDPSAVPSAAMPETAETPDEPMRLGQVRDAGFTLDDSRRQRARAVRTRVRRQRFVALVVVAVFLGFVAIGAASMVRNAVRIGERRATPSKSAAVAAGRADLGGGATALVAQPTPTFATFKRLQLHLPVSASALTELGFHQASFTYAFPVETWLKDADLAKAGDKHGTGRSDAGAVTDDNKLAGYVLRLWRTGRPGKPNTAVDVGALAGSPVFSPVDGVVLKVKPYKLYGKYNDYQVHIGPDGYSTVDVVLIHLTNPTVKQGDRVVAGVTQVGQVRRLSNLMTLELGSYTADAGDHTHLQLNNIKNPSYKGLTDE